MSKLFKSETKTGPAHIVRQASDRLSNKAKQCISTKGYTPREKDKNEALPAQDDIFARRPYKTGDGDTGTYVPRPGSLRAFELPSKGIAT